MSCLQTHGLLLTQVKLLSRNIILLSAAKDTLLFIIMYSLRSLPASPTVTRKLH